MCVCEQYQAMTMQPNASDDISWKDTTMKK